MFPAARIGDPITHDMLVPSGVIGPQAPAPCPFCASQVVLIEGLPAAHVLCTCICTGATSAGPMHPPIPGPQPPIVKGSLTVLIHNLPAARWTPSMDVSACGVFLGDPKLLAMRSVLIGDVGGVGGAGLGAGAIGIAFQSPTLAKKLGPLLADGWTISYGPAGNGTFADKTKKQIVIDSNEKGNDAAVVQSLAHEIGHAAYTADPYVPPTGKTREEYVSENAKNSLKDEGEATLTNVEVRDEIVAAGGPDIGIAGTQTKDYEAIKKKYPDPKDRDKAREEIGTIFATKEKPSTDPTKTYNDYYRKPYEDHWDKHVAKSP